ncbi:MAG: amidohydrolase family protein [Pseudomonadota bacterium]
MESAPPPPVASPPAERAPAGACDTHIHMLAAPDEFPLWEKRVEDPAEGLSFEDFLARYRAQMETLGIERTVVVHSILYGLDNTVTLRAVEALGRDKTRAIGLVPDGADEAALDRLRDGGAMGIRLNYVHGGVLSFEGAVALAPMLAAREMHLQMLVHTDQHMAELAETIRALPVPVVIDHIGWPPIDNGAGEEGFKTLCALMSEGHAYVKLSGLYRLSRTPYEATDPLVAALVEANPERCLWGSDFPYVMLRDAVSPDAGVLLDAFHRVVPEHHRGTILVENPAALYRF